MSASLAGSINPSHEAISDRACKLWQAAGSPEGKDMDFWLRAEKELKSESASSDHLDTDNPKGIGTTGRTVPTTAAARGPAAALPGEPLKKASRGQKPTRR
jgi:hypothetical protein